eukprot:g6811.t1
MNFPRAFLALRLFFFVFAAATDIAFGVLLAHRDVAHSDISWWLFSLETFALLYYAVIELFWNRLAYGRLSILGIIGSVVATQGVLANSMDPPVSGVLSMLVAANLGFIFSVGVRIRIPEENEADEIKPPNQLTKEKLKAHDKAETVCEITPADDNETPVVVIEDFQWTRDVFSESSETSDSVAPEPIKCCISPEAFSLILGICGLVLGIMGWILNLSIWLHECLDKETCSELGPQWWTLGQSCLLFVMYIFSTGLNRTFEVLASYSIFWTVPISIFLRVANTARSDFFFLKNQEDTYQTWDSDGTIVGSSLITIAGTLLLLSLGVLHYSWRRQAPEYTKSFRALFSLIGLLGLVIFGIGLKLSQEEVCDDNNDQICEWYDGLWVDVAFEVFIVLFGIFSVFTQPGESIRAILIALAVLPSYTYTINISRFLENWNLESTDEHNKQWAVRFSAAGLIILFCVNYAWIFAWGWGKSESLESKLAKGIQWSVSKSLLKSAKSVANKQNGEIMKSASQGVELGVMADQSRVLVL